MTKYSLLFTIIISLFTITSCSKAPIAEQLANAKTAIDSNDNNKATLLLKNILKDKPNNTQARVLLANAYNNLGIFINAEKEWDKAIENNAAWSPIITPYFETLYALKDSLEIIKVWQENSISLPDSIKADAAPIVALSFMRVNKPAESQKLFEQSISWAKSAKSLNAIIINQALWSAVLADNRADKIIHLSNACNKVPSHWVICSLTANVQLAQKDFINAAKTLEHLVELRPNYVQSVILLTESYVKSNNTDKALYYLNVLLKQYPKQPYINQLMALHSIQNQNFDLAKYHIETTLTQGFSTPETKLIAGLTDYQLENYEQALSNLISLRSSFPSNDFIQQILIAIQLKLGNTGEAFNELDQIELTKENTQMVAMAGIELLKSGDKTTGSKLIKKIDSSKVLDPNLLANIGLAKISGGDHSGVEDIENLFGRIQQDKTSNKNISKGKYLLISSLISTQQLSRAETKIQKWIEKSPSNVENYTLLVEIKKRQRPVDKQKIISIYRTMINVEPNNVDANIYFGATAFNNRDFTSALQHYQKALTAQSDNVKALQGYYLINKQLGKSEEALTYIEKALADYQTNPKHLLLLGQVYLSVHELQKAIALLENNIPETKNYLRIRNTLLGDTYLKTKQFNKAIHTYSLLLTDKNIDINLLGKQLYAYEKVNKVQEAINTLTRLKLKHPNNIQIGVLLANFHALTNKADEALTYIRSLTKEQQQNAMVLSIKGKALYKKQQYQQALPLLTADYQQTKNTRVAAFIFDSYVKLNKITDAFNAMDNHLISYPDDIANRVIYVSVLIKYNKNKVIEQYQKIVELDGNNTAALNNLAWYLYEKGQLSKALPYSKRAIILAPNDANIIDTYDKIRSALKNR